MASTQHSVCIVGRAEGAGIFAKAEKSTQNPEKANPPPSLQHLTLREAWYTAGQSFQCGWPRDKTR